MNAPIRNMMKKYMSLLLGLLCSLSTLAGAYDTTKSYTGSFSLSSWTSSNKGYDSTTSSLTINFSCNSGSVLSFNYTVSSEENYDKFSITLDGSTLIKDVSGEVSDSYTISNLSEGQHTLVFTYSKDSSMEGGSDQVTVSNIKLVEINLPWAAPKPQAKSGVPPYGTDILLKLVNKDMYLSKGTTWGTHAALTSNPDEALVYQLESYNGQTRFHANGAGNQGYLFIAGTRTNNFGYNAGEVYVDYYRQDISYTYFSLNASGDGFTINIPQGNAWWSDGKLADSPGLGWDGYNKDLDKDGNDLGTNIGIFMLGSGTGFENKWQYCEVELYNARLALYEELVNAYINGETIVQAASDTYNKTEATKEELQHALELQRGGGEELEDYTGWIVNPNIDGHTNGWTVDMPGAQNKGYQAEKSYKNGSVQINRFIEAWIPKPSYLGAGEISQSISGLPDGVYKLEADAIATDQSGKASPSTGVYLFAESDIMAQTSIASANEKPEHFTLTFVKAGNDLKIGLRTDADCTANWIAFDNVQLKRVGDTESDATAISVSPSSLNLIVGATEKLTASVTASSIYQATRWTSDNEEVATVDQFGNVAAHKSGTAHIKATAIGTLLTASCTVTVSIHDISTVVINEVQVCNLDQYLDPSFNYGGWIEIYNQGATPVNLGGAVVCDATDKAKRFKLPAEVGTVPARGFMNVWFDHNAADGDYGGKSENQVNFKLSAEGGTICLLDGDEQEVDRVTYPAPTPRCSYARTTDGGDTWGTTGQPTPQNTNQGVSFATERSAAPVVSRDGGLINKEEEYSITVTIPAQSTLLYTTDGSAPTANNASANRDYNSGTAARNRTISNSETCIYRFCIIEDGKLPSPIVTRSFIQRNHDYYLPVLSVTSDPENLFGDDHGIYTRGGNGSTGNGISYTSNTNRDWERPVNMEYMVPEMSSGGERNFITYVNQETDMEIAGGWTRNYYGGDFDGNNWFSRPSFRLKCDKRYEGASSINYPVFDHKPYNKYKVWQVRNGGNDRTSNNRFKDALLNEMVLSTGFYVDAQDWQSTHVFLNGRYVGVFNVRESNNRHYGDSNYGMDTDEMDQFDLSNARYNQKVGDTEAWNELVALSAELASSQREATYEEILKRIDLDEYLNYMALECYISSSDWLTNRNNFKGFRSRTDDGKFHFVFFDADQAFMTSNMLGQILNNDISGIDVDDLFRNLMQYAPIRRQFIDAHCIVGGSVMTPEIANAAYDKLYGKINEAMTWEGGDGYSSAAYAVTNNYKGYPMTYLRNQFGLYDVYDLTLSSNIPDAQLSLNGQQIPRAKFAGYAYNSGNGIHLTAKAPAGYRFLGWQLDGAKSESTTTTTTKTLIDFRAENWITSDYGVSRDGEDWTSADYPETGWANLDAPFGFASNSDKFMQKDVSTTLEKGTPRIPTYYFRHKFWFDKTPAAGSKLVFKYKIDDGFRAYINGKDIGGVNIGKGHEGYSNYTDNAAYAGDNPLEGTLEVAIEDLNLDFSGAPNNVLSVLLKNCSSTSSDCYFDASLELVEASEDGPKDYISTDETFCLNEVESAGTYTITACYETIGNERERWEAGATPIRINEVSAGNDIYINEHSKKSDWIELYNTTDEPINLTGLYLSDNARKPQKWQIAASAATDPLIIPAHGTRIVWCDDLEPLTQLHAPFKLSNADGACVSIQATDGRWQDRLDYEEQPRWTTYGRYPDGGNHTQLMAQPTIDKSNRLGTYDFTAVAPEEFLDEDVTITLALAAGWNWSSHNLASSVHPSRFTTYADILRGQSTELYKDPEMGWTGLLSAIEPALGYKLRMNKPAEVTLRGKPFDTQTDIELKKGWNWVAFPLLNATTVELATRDFVEGGDPTGLRIVGQDFSTMFSAGEWKGSLTVLQPGQAYLIYTSTATTLRWTTGSSSRSLRPRRYAPLQNEQASPWAFNLHAYPNVMPVTAEFNMDDRDTYRLLTDLQAEGQHFYLGAFAGDECRGIAVIDDERLYMNVHGEGGEPITFRLLTDEGDLYTAAQQTVMESLLLLGDYEEPYRLSFAPSSLTDVVQPMQSAQRVVSTEYYNLAGQRILQPTGICIMRQRLADGTIRTRKLK